MGNSERRMRRLDKIFQALADGKTTTEIHEQLGAPGKDERRGARSEEKVAQVLRGIKSVDRVSHARKDGMGDRDGIDLHVVVRGETPTILDTVKVQVKSSKAGVNKFRDELAERHGMEDADAVDQWLLNNKFIILLGTHPEAMIERNFNRQLTAIQVNEQKNR